MNKENTDFNHLKKMPLFRDPTAKYCLLENPQFPFKTFKVRVQQYKFPQCRMILYNLFARCSVWSENTPCQTSILHGLFCIASFVITTDHYPSLLHFELHSGPSRKVHPSFKMYADFRAIWAEWSQRSHVLVFKTNYKIIICRCHLYLICSVI